MDISIDFSPTPRSPVRARTANATRRIHETKSVDIEDLLQQNEMDTTDLLEVEMSMGTTTDDLIWE